LDLPPALALAWKSKWWLLEPGFAPVLRMQPERLAWLLAPSQVWRRPVFSLLVLQPLLPLVSQLAWRLLWQLVWQQQVLPHWP
jgi:hypothetical protein